jgi:hypothetical protein
MRHVDDGELHAYLDGAADVFASGEIEALESHLSECDGCRARLEEEREIRIRAASLLDDGAEPGPLSMPSYEELVRSRRPATVRWLVLPWAAVFVLGLGIGWIARERAPLEPLALEMERVQENETRAFDQSSSPPSARETHSDPRRGIAAAPVSYPSAAAGDSRLEPARASSVTPPGPESVEVAITGLAQAEPEPTDVPESLGHRGDARPPPEAPAMIERDDDLVNRGVVTEEGGGPLGGAGISLAGTSVRTITNPDGSYAPSVPTGTIDSIRPDTVRAVMIGYAAAGRPVDPSEAGTAVADIELSWQPLALDELVATGRSVRQAGGAWRPIDEAGARSILGTELPVVDGLRVTGIQRGEIGGREAVRVRQRLETGATVTLEIARMTSARVRAEREASTSEFVVVETRQAARTSEIVARSSELTVTLSAPVPLEELQALLVRLR